MHEGLVKMTLAEEVTFFNKGAILKELDRLPHDTNFELDVTNTKYLDNDIIEILDDFILKAEERNISIKLVSKKGVVMNPESFYKFFNDKRKAS
jgi:MFS superfamily sulfate permease-like transporter